MLTRDYVLHMPRATAERARGCERCTDGWVTFANEQAPLGAYRANWIRREAGFTFTELRTTAASALADGVVMPGEIDATTDPAAPVTVFRFAGGQPCFQHPRPAQFFAGQREHVSMRDWIDDLDEHVGQLEDQIRRG